MLETINKLAALLVEKAPGQIRIAVNEEDTTRDPQPEAAHFLKFNLNGDERRMGRDFEVYNFMATVAGSGDSKQGQQYVLTTLLEEWLMRIQSYAPEAFKAGIAFLREQGSIFGSREQEWYGLLDAISKPSRFEPTMKL